MSDIKLFSIKSQVEERKATNVNLEKELQNIIEKNMYMFFRVTFLASEFATSNGGRMDSIGIDEDNSPVIFEYKRNIGESVMNQGLFYLDWLLDHKDTFRVLVEEKINKEVANNIDWTSPRVICIAGDFNKFDVNAVNRINRDDTNISLIRYRKYDDDLLMFEQLNENIQSPKNCSTNIDSAEAPNDDAFEKMNDNIKKIYQELKDYLFSLGDDISEIHKKHYVAFRKIKNFASFCFQQKQIKIYLSLDVNTVEMKDGFTRDVTDIGHHGTSNLEMTISDTKYINEAKELLQRAYNEN